MNIKIVDKSVCEACTFKSCSINDVIEKVGFYHLKSERYVCPVKLMLSGPSDEQLDSEYMDVAGCIGCNLCLKKCNSTNLIMEHLDQNSFSYLDSLNEQMASITCNNLALSYLNELFEFAANTNINKSLSFDGYVVETDGNQYFVEVSFLNDSLESCRRLLSDIATHNFASINKIHSGIIVLKHMPEKGSRDIFPLVNHIVNFPGTKDIQIYVITFDLLKKYVTVFEKNQKTVQELMFNITSETIEAFNEKIDMILNNG